MSATALATTGPHRQRSLFRHADFRRLWIGETTSSLGSNVTEVALPLVALTVLHSGVVAVSLLSALAWVPWLLFGLPAGAYIDRLRHRPVMVACDAISLLLFASVPLAATLGVLTLGQLFAVAFGTGVAKVAFSTAYRTFLPVLLEPEQLVTANSRLQSSESAAQVVGPGLGGVLAQVFGAANALLADAVSFLVSMTCLLRMQTRESSGNRSKSRLRRDIAQGLRFVGHDQLLRSLMLFGALANLALAAYDAIVLVFLVRDLGLRPATAGLLFAAGSIGGVLGSLAAPLLSRRVGSARALLMAKVGSLPLTLLIPLSADGWKLSLFIVGTVALVTGVVTGNVVSAGFMQGYCPAPLRARVSATMSVVNYGAMPLGALTGGLLAHSVGFRPALFGIFGLFVASGGLLLASPLRGMRDLPTHPPAAVAANTIPAP